MCARGGFFSRAVSVTVEPGEEGELQVMRIVMMMMWINYYGNNDDVPGDDRQPVCGAGAA